MRIFLIGLSGSGKSTVGHLLAARLGVPLIDTDADIARQAGRSVAEIFRTEGEPAFRARERAAIAAACAAPAAVVATGGGAPADPENRRAMRRAGTMVWLDASTPHLLARLRAQPGNEVRPLLLGEPETALERLRAERRTFYAEAALHVNTEHRDPEEIVAEIIAALPPDPLADPLWVRTPSQTYPVYIGPGLLDQAATLLDRHSLTTPLRIIADERVAALHGDALRKALGGRVQTWYLVPAGEEHKTLDQVARLYDALLGDRVERGDLIVAFGGGVIGDLVGFVAATVLRGVRFVQIPTTVLSQVDSSVGGKAGVDHPRGKNLIGAFHQPSLVLADVGVLGTLPPREIAAGLAEVVKIAVIQDAPLFEELERMPARLAAVEPAATTRVIRRAVELKARVVEQDERDLTGARAILNYGHTLGHALEAASGYATILHGEGVAIGMRGAAWIAQQMGLHPVEAVARQAMLLDQLELPQALAVSPDAVRAALGLDKKRSGGRTQWILPSGLGRVTTSREVPDDLVDRAIRLVTGAGES